MTRPDPGSLALDYLLAAREGGLEAGRLERSLAELSEEALCQGLADDQARIAFWLDVYNAFVLRSGEVDLTSSLRRWRHFRSRSVMVAGEPLSLDTIEHGLLRHSRWKFGLGYVAEPFPSRFERRHRVERIDPRVHFALNCGAVSCPPIAAYDRTRLDEQLELATASYLRTEVRSEAKVLRVPALLFWYIGDFGGPPGLRRLLQQAGIRGWGRPLRMHAWDWTPDPDQWRSESADDPTIVDPHVHKPPPQR